jgi:sigma-B regulation protein RsbU (phosphoserine phosphatase)
MDPKKFPKFIPSISISPTARGGRGEVLRGLEAGADDNITKPYDLGELRARVQVGVRLVELQHTLANRVRELEEALARVKQLNGLLPICP